jgi:phage tail sheath gpL-like
MISYSSIPSALRYPGVYVEVDGSRAGLGGDLPAVLLVGQKLATGTAASGEVTPVASVQDAVTKAGAGSMLAQMVTRYRAIDPTLDIYMLPYTDLVAGVAATGSVTVTGTATAAGTLSLYIAGKAVKVPVTAGQVATAVATAIAAAITDIDIPVTASAAAAVVTLTSRHKGSCGNDIDLRLNLYSEATPAGLTVALTAMAGGTGDPVPGNLATILGQRWYRYVALGIKDTATLVAWHTESQRRYAPPVQQGFRAFLTFRGDYASAVTFGTARNSEHICALSTELNPTSTWEAAAILAAAAARASRSQA